jgi:hypothetical protein
MALLSPRTVPWQPSQLGGIPVERADGLVLQCEQGEDVWASRGYSIYRSSGGGAFRRVASLRPPFGEAWGGYLGVLRRRFGYQELVEVAPLSEGALVAFGGGWAHHVDLDTGRVSRTHQLRYFGRGKGRGLMAFGLTSDVHGSVYYGEYPRSGQTTIRVWRSDDAGRTWDVAVELEPGFVRHIHAVQWDPYADAMWIATGDGDAESRIGYTNGSDAITWIGEGSQEWRSCSLLFFPDSVVWPMDSDDEPNFVLRWDRATGAVTKGTHLPHVSYYAHEVDERTGLVGLCDREAAVWVTGTDGRAVPWLRWELPERRTPVPPGVRLARGSSTAAVVHVNPLRTRTDEAAIYRIARERLPSPAEAVA